MVSDNKSDQKDQASSVQLLQTLRHHCNNVSRNLSLLRKSVQYFGAENFEYWGAPISELRNEIVLIEAIYQEVNYWLIIGNHELNIAQSKNTDLIEIVYESEPSETEKEYCTNFHEAFIRQCSEITLSFIEVSTFDPKNSKEITSPLNFSSELIKENSEYLNQAAICKFTSEESLSKYGAILDFEISMAIKFCIESSFNPELGPISRDILGKADSPRKIEQTQSKRGGQCSPARMKLEAVLKNEQRILSFDELVNLFGHNEHGVDEGKKSALERVQNRFLMNLIENTPAVNRSEAVNILITNYSIDQDDLIHALKKACKAVQKNDQKST